MHNKLVYILLIGFTFGTLVGGFSLNNYANKTALYLEENKNSDIQYISMTLGTEPEIPTSTSTYKDEVEELFDKFNVPIEYRDFIRQICLIYDIPLVIGVTLGQIESKSGKDPNYNKRTEKRAYWIKGVKCWDDGYMQLNSYYHTYFEKEFFNPELIFSLGYVRNKFNPNDDFISIQVGLNYLSYLRHYYNGDWEKAIACYNTGYYRVNNDLILESTKRYVHAIINGHAYIGEEI